ncbi:hypothetical protein [Vibrio metschnikovii]|uniref:Uncharacterized protein n=1 Tax=Vibrio metschnikovii TaxID=28172 RepID=A0A9X0R7T4_VIBME|nr:hypothetical protein [Vibrio metschnikovii]MBC5851218.1 hypothetical protein [Vibrio metschnikovii]
MNINTYYARKVPTVYMASPSTPRANVNELNHFKYSSQNRKVVGLEQKSAGDKSKGCSVDVFV